MHPERDSPGPRLPTASPSAPTSAGPTGLLGGGPALPEEVWALGLESRVRLPLAELLEKVEALARAVLPAEHKRLAQKALAEGRAILGEVEHWLPAPTPEPRTTRVLLVDSDRVERKVLEGFLSVEGIEAEAEPDPKRALTILGERRFDVAIVDAELGGIGAQGVLSGLRSAEGDGPPVVLLVDEARHPLGPPGELHADAFLARPLDLGSVERVLRPLLRRAS